LLGGILIGLSRWRKFPQGKEADSKSKTAISRLRISLQQLTGIEEDPFFPFNEGDGWKPRFNLTDDRKNADERAKREAIHVSYEDAQLSDGGTQDFDHENDDAGRFITGKAYESYMKPPTK
jgi:hypothetical protein